MPPISAVIAMLVAAVLLMGSPGPATMSLAASGAAFGIRPVVPYLCGICIGTAGVLLIVSTGVTGLVLSVPGVTPMIVAVAGAYILYLAWKIATAPPPTQAAHDDEAPSIFGGLLLAIANPKAYAAIGAVYSSSVLVDGRPLEDAVIKVAVLSFVIVAANSVWLLFGAGLAGLLRRPKAGRVLNIVFAGLLIASFALSVLL
ncbi:LysE family translocator [Microbaculum marinisediminis]|uniref:LysE family translocator n=1 Tax=Microbaculum marinisediminis TaxID=2931392 RepID=A0AAW5QWN4_9HYPH|nr:LysE family translocator [Microbaculum sp. A6E488]MCT8971309.1 LysE family translocator [Microbaculum sp. A6E488]